MTSSFERLMSKPHLTGPKRQHYVPRFYLEGFTTGGFLSVFDRRASNLSRQTPENTGVVGHLYTFEDHQNRRRFDMEKLFSYIENKSAPIVRKLIGGERLEFEERDCFTTFLALAAVRTPASIAEGQVVEEGVLKARMLSKLGDEDAALTYLRGRRGTDADEAKLRRMAKSLTRMVRENAYKIQVDPTAAFSRVARQFHVIAEALWKRDWLLVRPASDADKFITTDSPVVLTVISSQARSYPLGYGSPHGQVLFPLSADAALVLAGHQSRFGQRDLPSDQIRRFNLTVATNCHRYVFGSDDALVQAISDELNLAGTAWQPRIEVGTVRRGNSLFAFIRGRAR